MRIFEFAISLLLRLLPCAFSAAGMNRLHAGTNGLWLYRTAADANATVQGANYFNAYVNELQVGDIIIVSASDEADVLQVSSNDGSTVVVADLNVV